MYVSIQIENDLRSKINFIDMCRNIFLDTMCVYEHYWVVNVVHI